MTTPSIRLVELTKRYGDFTALDRVSLQVEPGEIFGFLGPNGAGKTTTMRILMGMLLSSSGKAEVEGLDCAADRVELKRRMGYLPDTPTYYDYLRAEELFRFAATMHGFEGSELRERVASMIARMGLEDASREFVMNFSLGMKKKVALGLALLHEPSVLILDEPTTGLDPIAARQIRETIRSAASAGRTVLLSTHLMEMANQLCDRVGIIHQGRIAAVGTPGELREDLVEGGSLEEVFLAVTVDARGGLAEPA
ncbi:MAG: ABC transporter ATP-binding protein [Myxococcota bacterium]